MSVRFSEVEISTTAGPRTALVISPTRHVVVGRERLAEPIDQGLSAIDRVVLEHVQRRKGQIDLTVFQGVTGDGTGSYRLDPRLSQTDADELGYRLVRGQLPVYQAFVQLGVCLHIHCDWGTMEADSFRLGTLRLALERESANVDEVRPARARDSFLTDAWILRNLCFYFSSPLRNLVDRVLPEHLPLMERRRERARARLLRNSSTAA